MKRKRPSTRGAAAKSEAGGSQTGAFQPDASAQLKGVSAKGAAADEMPPSNTEADDTLSASAKVNVGMSLAQAEADDSLSASAATPPPRRPPPTRRLGWMSDDSAAQVAIDTATRQRGFAAAIASDGVRPTPLPEQDATPAAAVFQNRLSERPADIRDAARSLAKAITGQIEDLNASKPNDGEGLAKHNDLVSFLEQIAAGLTELGEALDRVVNASAKDSLEPVFLGKAGEIAHQLNVGLMEFLERNRAHIAGFPIRTGLFLSGYWFLKACGVEGYIAGVASGLLNASLPKAKTRTAEGKNQNQKKRRSR
jgi:hypothetical protein